MCFFWEIGNKYCVLYYVILITKFAALMRGRIKDSVAQNSLRSYRQRIGDSVAQNSLR